MNTTTTVQSTRPGFSLRWRDFSLGAKLIIALLAVAIIPLVIIAVINTQNTQQALTSEANEKLFAGAKQTAAILDAFMAENTHAVRAEAQFAAIVDYITLPEGQRANSPEESRLLRFLAGTSRKDPVYLNSIAILDAKGITLIDTEPSANGTDRSDRVYFQEVILTNRPYASTVEYDSTTKKPSIYFAAPVHDAAGNIIGIIRKRFDAAVLMEYVIPQKGLVGAGSFPVLLDENHVRLAHGANVAAIYKSVVPLDAKLVTDLQTKRLLPPGTPEELATNRPDFEAGLQNAASQPYFAAELTTDGNLEQVAVTSMTTQNWLVVFAVPQTQFLAPINQQAQSNILLTLGIGFIVGLVGLFVSRTLSGPITRLTHTAEAIAAGDINIQAKVESSDEIGTLAGTFNRMTSQLRDFIATLELRVADRTKALATAGEVSRRISTITDEQKLVVEVVNQLQSAFNYYHAHIYLLDDSGENLLMAGGTGEAGRILLERGHKIQHGRGLVGRAAESREIVLVPDTSKAEGWLPNPLLPETKAEIAVPILAGNKALGVLDVQNNIVNSLGQQDADLISSIASQVAIALQTIRQFQTTQKMANDLGVVATVGIATATITEAQKLLQEVVDLAKKSFNLYHAHIYLLNESGDTLVLTAGAGETGRQMVSEGRTIPFDREQSLVARAARSQAGVVVNDVTLDPDFLPNPLLPDTRAEMAVPMMVGGKVVGVLDVQSEQVNRFTEVDVNIKTTLAAQVAVALQNSRSFAQAQQEAEREAVLNQISQKIQSAPTVEIALQTAARELGRALGMRPTMVSVEPAALSGERKAVQE